MNRYQWVIGGALALVVVVAVVSLFRSKEVAIAPVVDGGKPSVSHVGGRQSASGQEADKALKAAGRAKKQPGAGKSAKQTVSGRPGAAATAGKQKAESDKKSEAAEQAVAAWETLVDELAETKDAPTAERKDSVKAAFDKLDADDQMDAVHRALNLLPDEQFPSLYGILYDKRENAEVLDAIFSDALNRPEDIKVPIMKDLVQDKEHPMFFESARILDVTGELEKMTGDGAEKADDDAAAEEEEAPAEENPAAP